MSRLLNFTDNPSTGLSVKQYYTNSVATIKRGFAEVAEYFESIKTNGIVEEINNKLKFLKRCEFGFKNFNTC